MKIQTSRMAAITFASVFALVLTARAQTTGAGPSSASTTGATSHSNVIELEEVVVTAEKTKQPLQHVPASVSVMSSRALRDFGVTDLTQINILTSGLSITPLRTQAVTFLRGVGTTVTTPNADPSVAINLNGVYLPAELAGAAFFDVERIEVVPGPQGTLYGRNSTGGVINIVSRTPGRDFAIDGSIEAGNYGRVDTTAGVDIPITDSLASRTSGMVIRHNGYFTNGEDDEDTYAGRETLAWTASDRTEITGRIGYTHNGGIGDILENVIAPPVPGCLRCLNFDPQALAYHTSDSVVEASLQADQRLNSHFTLTYIGGYSSLDLGSHNSIFTAPVPFFPDPLNVATKIKSQSHEVRLNVAFSRLQGILGAYYFDQTGHYLSDAIPGLPVPGHAVALMDLGSHGSAAFGQGTYSITDDFRVIAGVRYSSTSKGISGYDATYTTAGYSAADLSAPGIEPFVGHATSYRPDWKVGFEYNVTADSMLYTNVATGYTAGGFSNAQAGVPTSTLQEAASFAPVTMTAYAAGIKNQFANRRVTVNFEGFYYDYKNYQVSARSLSGLNLVFNAGKATIYGGQLDVHFTPTNHDDFSASVTGLYAVADTLIVPGQNYSGYSLPYAPNWSGYVDYQHIFDLNNEAQIRAGVNFRYLSGQWSLYTHQPGSDIGSNTETDLNVGYYAPDGRWSVQAWVRNLENSLVESTCGNALPHGDTGCFFEPPRTYGLTLMFRK